MRDLPVIKFNVSEPEKFGNLAEKIDVAERKTLANDIMELVTVDESSMSDWLGAANGYLDALDEEGKNQSSEDSEQQGSNEGPPPSTEMTLSSVVQFSARATGALLGDPDLLKASKTGSEKLAAWVSEQFRTVDPRWIKETDPLTIHMSVTGRAWRKRAFDRIDKVFSSHFLTVNDVIINSNALSVSRAPRITHQFERYPYEIERSIQRKRWTDYKPQFHDNDPQAPKKFYEVDLWLDLDGDEIAEPWTIVVSRDDIAEVIKIEPRWSAKTVSDTKDALIFNPIHRFYPYDMLPDPRGTPFPIGFGKLLSRIEGSADHLLAAIVDTAQSSADDGGVMGGSAFGMPDSVELKRNRVTLIPTDGRSLGDNFQMLPTKQVSAGSVQILEKLLTLGDRMAGTLNVLENAPASMSATLARGIIDSGTSVQSAVHGRMVGSMTEEAKMFVKMADAYGMLPEGVSVTDSDGIAVTADPRLATEMHRAALGNQYLQMAEFGSKVPGSFSVQECCKRFCETTRLVNPMALLAPPPGPPQATPDEKMKGMLGLMKHKNDKIKITGQVAVQLTQAIKNLVDAAGGIQNAQLVQLQMAQLEHAVQSMVEDANASSQLGGMDGQPGNPTASGVPSPTQGGDGGQLPSGDGGGPGGPGPSGPM